MMSRPFSALPAVHRLRWGVGLAAVVTAVALTGCGSTDSPAAEPSPTSAVAQMSAPPQTTVAAPTGASTESPDAPAATRTPAASNGQSDSVNPADNTAPITPVDPARYTAYGDEVGWTSPSGKVSCRIGSSEFSSGCQSSSAPVPAGAEADCAPNSTFSVDTLSKGFYLSPGKVTPTCFNQGVFGIENAQPLEYNTSITFNGFTCYSRIEAMICDAGSGHGFVLSTEQATWN